MLLESGSTKAVGLLVGVSSLALGVVDAVMGNALFSPLNILSGGSLLVVIWVGNRLVSIADRFVVNLGQKVIDLPDAETLDGRHKSLLETLEEFAREARREREETQRELKGVAVKLGEHAQQISGLTALVKMIGERRG